MNKVLLIGNLTNKPTEAKFDSGNTVCRFTIAITRQHNKNVTDFINILCWNALAQNYIKYLDKGNKVAVAGSIQTGSYEKNGVKHFTTEVRAEQIEFLCRPKSVQMETQNEDVFEEVTDDSMPY